MALDNRPSLGDVVGEINNHIRDNDWTKPRRLQRKRSKGWRMPPNAVYVGRPSKWGNPFIVRKHANKWVVVREEDPAVNLPFDDKAAALKRAVGLFRAYANYYGVPGIDQLAGKDLMCWCPVDSPCHADVLLEIANK